METDPEKFWKKQGKKYNEEIEIFIGKHKAMEEAVASIVSPNDSPEMKIAKIYARVLQIHNNSMDAEKSEKSKSERSKKKLTMLKDVGSADTAATEQDRLPVSGLARAAGIEAYEVISRAPRASIF